MTPFFSSSNVPGLRQAALSWCGTPFAPGGSTKGPRGGACCHRLVAAAIAEADFPVTQEEMPDGNINRATHHPGSVMADWLRANPERFLELPQSSFEFSPGDILIIRLGIGAHHAALVLDNGEVLQTWQRIGAHISPLDQRLLKRIHAAFRPIKMEA